MMARPREQPPKFHVGDWVSFLDRKWPPRAQIIDDLGCLGVNGMRLYRVRADIGLDEDDSFQVREEDLVAELGKNDQEI
jgi:hypothetical protein